MKATMERTIINRKNPTKRGNIGVATNGVHMSPCCSMFAASEVFSTRSGAAKKKAHSGILICDRSVSIGCPRRQHAPARDCRYGETTTEKSVRV